MSAIKTSLLTEGYTTVTTEKSTKELTSPTTLLLEVPAIIASSDGVYTNFGPTESKLKEISDKKDSLQSGFFTASLAVLLKTVNEMNRNHTKPIIQAFHDEVLSLNTRNEFVIFGEQVPSILEPVIRHIQAFNAPAFKEEAKYALIAIDRRNTNVLPDLNAILEVADRIFTIEDATNVANAVEELENYPDTTKTERNIVREVLQAFLFIPRKRIEGKREEKELLDVIKKSIDFRSRGPMITTDFFP